MRCVTVEKQRQRMNMLDGEEVRKCGGKDWKKTRLSEG